MRFNIGIFLIGDGSFSEKEPSPIRKKQPQSEIFYFQCIKNPFLDKNNKKLFKRGWKIW